jgi:hypothetical protein
VSNITFDAPPTVARFMKSDSFGRLIAGPVGSGKTTGCIFELLRRSCDQWPGNDGYRYTRFAIVRQTLKQLKDTILKDILSWLPGIATWKVSDSTVYIDIGDVRSEWLMIPLEDQEDQKRLLSSQLTGAWMSEAIEMDVNLIAAIAGRMPRYPSGNRGLPKWSGIIADTNFPTIGSEWHKMMTESPPDWQIFEQPGGLTDQAENLDWLNQTPDTLKLPLGDAIRRAQGRLYYERLGRNTNPDWVRRYVHAKYGDDPSGTAVFRESFKRSFHVVDSVEPVQGHPLLIGQDFGRDPWSIICQLDHKGRLLVLQEVAAEDIGLELHLTRSLRPALADIRYMGRPVALIGDPAGVAKSSIHEETSFDAIKRLGFQAFPAPTNDIDPRIRAIEAFLSAQSDGGPAMLIDKNRCPTIVRALDGGYRYDRTKAGFRKPAPSKNNFSHPIDALQYACLAAHGGMTTFITRKMQRWTVPTKRRVRAGAWT